MSDVKAAVAAMMKLPKAERLERLMAQSAECVARQEDAAPLLALIQMELDTPDELELASASRPASSVAPSSRPASSASAANGAAALPVSVPQKSMRRQLKERRDELRAMLAKVDGALSSSGGSGQRAKPDAIAFAHMSRGEKLQLARQAGYRASGGASASQASRPRVEVPEHIKQRFREEYDADPEAFRRTWSEQTPEFRRLCAEPSKPPTPKEPRSGSSHGGGSSRGGTVTKTRPLEGLDEAQIEALLRKATQGGKAQVSDARAAGSTFSF